MSAQPGPAQKPGPAEKPGPAQKPGPTHKPGPADTVGPARLKGLSHPLRVKILTLLQVHGSLTASGLAELVGESSGSTSYHLRQLAQHGFVREVTDKGTARERWWEASPDSFIIGPEESDDVATRSAKSLINNEFERDRQANVWRLLELVGTGAELLPGYEAWRNAVVLSTTNVTATPEQLEKFIADYHEFLTAALEPMRDQKDVPGARPVQIHFNAFPVVPEKLPGPGAE